MLSHLSGSPFIICAYACTIYMPENVRYKNTLVFESLFMRVTRH